METNHPGTIIQKKRKELKITQMELATRLNVSYQAVSRWENGVAYPDIQLLPKIASILNTSTDVLLNHQLRKLTAYEDLYQTYDYYWGLVPNVLCYDILRLRPPTHPQIVLDIGCGEGKDAVFLARNGYRVMAFDYAESGLNKARSLAANYQVDVDFFRADIHDYRLQKQVDIIFSSGAFHYIKKNLRAEIADNIKEHVASGGLIALNVFVDKPFIPKAPDEDKPDDIEPWKSGEILTLFHDWKVIKFEEITFNCNSSGVPHQHCMDIMVAEKV